MEAILAAYRYPPGHSRYCKPHEAAEHRKATEDRTHKFTGRDAVNEVPEVAQAMGAIFNAVEALRTWKTQQAEALNNPEGNIE